MEKRYSTFEVLIADLYDQMEKRVFPEKKKQVQKKWKKRKKKRYPRDEALYNRIQEAEFDVFIDFLPVLAEAVLAEILPCSVSSATFDRYYRAVVCLSIKRYFTRSYRRGMGVIKYVVKNSFPRLKVSCFKTLNNYILNPDFTNVIDRIIFQSASLLSWLETSFSTDATGEATIVYSSWYHIRIGKKIHRREHVKIHLTSTTKANMVICVDTGRGKDNYYLQQHVHTTAQVFNISDWQGDSMYLCRKNCNIVYSYGGNAHFKIKSNTTTKPKKSQEWKRMVIAQKNKDKKEIDQYNKRQNVESTIYAKKRKCGSFIPSKDWIAQENDAKLGYMTYNFTQLSRLVHEFNITNRTQNYT